MQKSQRKTTSLLVEEARLRAHLGTPTRRGLYFAEMSDTSRRGRSIRPATTSVLANETIQRCAAGE